MGNSNTVMFMRHVGALKNVQRAGWRIRGIKECESVADHTFGTALLCMLLLDELAESGTILDSDRVLRLALLHDLAESVIGDIPQPRNSPVAKEQKSAIESSAFGQISSLLGSGGRAYLELWEEFDSARTPEARLVRAADKLEMLIQAAQYEHVGYRCLDAFWENQGNRAFFEEFPPVAAMAAQLEAARSGASAAGPAPAPEPAPAPSHVDSSSLQG